MQLPTSEYFLLTVPEPHVLLITINRPKQFNALNPEANWEMNSLLDWAENEDEIWCIIITGAGGKSFCAGMDLVNWGKTRQAGAEDREPMPPTGFAGLANRSNSRKPIIAAVDGFALGGGTEMLLACNIIVATQRSKFGLPEVKRGVTIAGGGLARLARALTYQQASEIALTGRFLTADEFNRLGFVNEVVSNDKNIVEAALEWAKKIVANSPDAVFITKIGINFALEHGSMVEATKAWLETDDAVAWRGGENLTEGLTAFAMKRPPQWKNPAPVVRKSKL